MERGSHTPDRHEPPEQQLSEVPSLAERRVHAQNWFRQNVTDTALSARVPVDLTVRALRDHDDFGRFEAWIGTGPVEGRLARRPRSQQPWDEFWISDAQTWSTALYDWAIHLYGVALDGDALADLRRQLHPNDEVIGGPPVER